jgi:hypothetical protein
MVFLNLTKSFNQWLGPFLLRNGLRARYVLGQGVIRDSPQTDALLWIPLAQKLISLEVHDECQKAILKGRVEPSWREYISGGTKSSEPSETAEGTSPNRPSDAELRLQVLEKYLRPALVKNEQWSNVQTWQFHNRFRQWARTEFLVAKHGPDLRGALDAFPAVRRSPQLTGSRSLQRRMGGRLTQMLAGNLPFDKPETNADGTNANDSNSKLPTSAALIKAFQLQDWNLHKDHGATGKEMRRIATEDLGGQVIELRGKSLRFVDAPPDQDVSKLTLEEILEAAGGHVMNCGPLNVLCEEAGVYQLWTREYIENLGKYLLKRTAAFGGKTIVLDVGAGDGLLAQSLRNYFEKGDEPRKSRKSGSRPVRPVQASKPSSRRPLKIPSVVAADDGSWSITVSEKVNVENLGVEEVIARYATDDSEQQVIVLCSWMPMGDDWTPIFRKGGVDEYILIGESDDGQCGDNWETWGNHDFLSEVVDKELTRAMGDDSISDNDTDSQTADAEASVDQSLLTTPRAYEAEGYARNDLDNLLPYQFSRYDCAPSKFGKTVSFRRVDRS